MAGDTVTVPEKRMLTISVLGQVLKPPSTRCLRHYRRREVLAGDCRGADLSLAKLMRRAAPRKR